MKVFFDYKIMVFTQVFALIKESSKPDQLVLHFIHHYKET